MILYQICAFGADLKFKMATMTRLSLTLDPMGIPIFIFFSETTKQIWTKLGRNVHWMVIYKILVFGTDLKSNMAARAHNVFWLAEILKIFLLETTKPIELWLCRNDHWVVLC